jgi:hypothetical protein
MWGWGVDCHEPVDCCWRCFDRALDGLGNGYAEMARLTRVATESVWRSWALPGIERLTQHGRGRQVDVLFRLVQR